MRASSVLDVALRHGSKTLTTRILVLKSYEIIIYYPPRCSTYHESIPWLGNCPISSMIFSSTEGPFGWGPKLVAAAVVFVR